MATVEFMNLTVAILGEVVRPGCFNTDKDRLTLLDALSMAGDLTVYGIRDNVLVQREDTGKKVLYQINLNSGYDPPSCIICNSLCGTQFDESSTGDCKRQ